MDVHNESSGHSLYTRLGGYDVIAFVDNMLEKLRQDPRFSRFGPGRSADSHRRSRQLSVDLICQLAAGPSFNTGRDMKTSHAGLEITETVLKAYGQLQLAAINKCMMTGRIDLTT